MASSPPPPIETSPTKNLYFNPYSGGIHTILFTIKNTGPSPIDFRISSSTTTITFAPKEGTISGKNETRIEVTTNTNFAARSPEMFTIDWINSFNLNKKNNFTTSQFRGTKNINIIFNAENKFYCNGPFNQKQTLYQYSQPSALQCCYESIKYRS
ncbi:unnamed protein product [Meloidogyne enterolobii]|uniref:Uncharacterized protein n=1 Tax=Meloidogyne enterolobii TaxID=390850 RepID=A0ACB0YPX7_MELEN